MRLVKNPSYKHSKETIAAFKKLEAYIYYKDHTQYNEYDIEKMIRLVKLAKKEFKIKAQTMSWWTQILIKEHWEGWKRFKVLEKRDGITAEDFDFEIFEYMDLHEYDEEDEGNSILQSVKEDYLSVLSSYDKNKKYLPDISTFNTIRELSQAIENLNMKNLIVSDKTLDVFFEFDGWFAAMPHTKEASCFLGKNTSWCTARTKSENYFRYYTADPEANIFLFYLIRLDGEPLKNPMDKISIGFVDCIPIFDSNMTVDALNRRVRKNDLVNIFEDTMTEIIIDEMVKKCKQIRKHPSRVEMETLVKNRELFKQKLDSIENSMEKLNFIKQALRYKTISGGVLLETMLYLPKGEHSFLSYFNTNISKIRFTENEMKEIIDNNQIIAKPLMDYFFTAATLTKNIVLYALNKKTINSM